MEWIEAQTTFFDENPLGKEVAEAVANLPYLYQAESGEVVGVRLTGWHVRNSLNAEAPMALVSDRSDLRFRGKTQTEILSDITGTITPNQRAALLTLGATMSACFERLRKRNIQWAESYEQGAELDMRSIIVLRDAIMLVDDVHDYHDELDLSDTPVRSHLWIQIPPSKHAQIALTDQMEALRVLYEKLSIRDASHRGRLGYRQICFP
jgi:hypothetical protein